MCILCCPSSIQRISCSNALVHVCQSKGLVTKYGLSCIPTSAAYRCRVMCCLHGDDPEQHASFTLRHMFGCLCHAGQSERAKPGSIVLTTAAATSRISDQCSWAFRVRPDSTSTAPPGAAAKHLSGVIAQSSGAHQVLIVCECHTLQLL